jgi:hypothetical protein
MGVPIGWRPIPFVTVPSNLVVGMWVLLTAMFASSLALVSAGVADRERR